MGRISMPQGRGSLKHNIRDYTQEEKSVHTNIDFDKTNQNIIFVHRNIKDAYEKIFGDAVREYNAKQKRNDRKIKDDDYLSKVKTSKNGEHTFYEDVLQWGTQHDFYDRETREKAKKALTKYIETFEERNPNLKLIGAYIHMDEASPHLHFDYIPVATGYKTGLPIRNSLSKAMEQMGYVVEKGASKKNNQTMLWKENERAYFASLCEEVGLEVEPEKTWGRANLSVEEYKEAKMEMDDRILQLAEKDLTEKKKIATKKVEQYEKDSKAKIDAEVSNSQKICDEKITAANKKADAIIADANYQVEGIKAKADRTKLEAEEKLKDAENIKATATEQMKWVEGRLNAIRFYEEAGSALIDFFKVQLKSVKKVIAKVSGLVVSSSTFSLEDTRITHATYHVENTNPYPVVTNARNEALITSFDANEGLILPQDNKLVNELVDGLRDGSITVSRVNLSPEIRRKNVSVDFDIDAWS